MDAQIIGQLVDGAMLSGKSIEDADVDQTDISRIVREYGGTVRLLHPGTTDATLRRYFVVDVHQDVAAEALAERLRTVPAVDGAYVKPAGEAPSGMP